jgi:hypothetical protein
VDRPPELEDDRQARLIVRGIRTGDRPSRHVERFNRAQAQSAEQDVKLKGFYAYFLPTVMVLQLAAADVGFFLYAQWGVDWEIDTSIMHVWLGATVVEVIGIVLVVTRYLFPRRDQTSAPSDLVPPRSRAQGGG